MENPEQLKNADKKLRGMFLIMFALVLFGVYWYWAGEMKTANEEGKVFSPPEELLNLIRGSGICSEVGVIGDSYFYNENSETWWFDLEREPSLELDGCHPACVASLKNMTTEVNWRCTGLTQEKDGSGEVILCSEEDRKGDVCAMDYSPVCAKVAVRCIKAPCPPVEETFSNSCMACHNSLVESYAQGECGNSQLPE